MPVEVLGSTLGCQTDAVFEMFAKQAREALVRAQDEAGNMGHQTARVARANS